MREPGRLLLLVSVLALAPALPALDSRSFFSPDETNYTQVAREMLETGDVVVPHLDGKPWFNKPPLAYWLLVSAFALLGWGLPAAVLLNTALTAAVAWVVGRHAARTIAPPAGFAAAAVYLTMALPIAVARTALTDPILVLCTTLAVALFLRGRRWDGAMAGAFLGLGVLAKGPIAPLVVVPAILAATLNDRTSTSTRRLLAAAITSVAVVAPWQVALVVRGVWSAWAQEFLGQEVVSRATESWRIAGPWWYYLPAVWIAAFPWGTHLLAAARSWWRGLSAEASSRSALVAEAAAVTIPMLAFSLATNKLPHYILPVMPFLAVGLARVAVAREHECAAAFRRRVAGLSTFLGVAFLATLALLAATSRVARFLPPSTWWLLLLASLAYAVSGYLEFRGHRVAGWAGLAVVALALRLGLDVSVVPHLDRQLPERPLAESIAANLPAGGAPIAHRWWRTGFLTYGVRGWTETASRAELKAALDAASAQGREALVVARSDGEGEVRAVTWERGGVAREVARIAGLGEINGEVLEGVVFLVDARRDSQRWFWDADSSPAGTSGFDAVESAASTPTFRWTVAPQAIVDIPATPPDPAVLRIAAWGLPQGDREQRASLALNGYELGELELTRYPERFAVPVPSTCLRGGIQELTMTADHLAVPAEEVPGSQDGRALGVAVDWLALEPAVPRVDLLATGVRSERADRLQ